MFTVDQASNDAHWRDATALLHDYVDWVRGWMGVDPIAEEPRIGTELRGVADQYASGEGAYYLAHWHGIGVGAVAIRVHPDGSAELKRMYLRPVARGRGVSDRLIDAAITGALDRRCHTVWLQTVRGAMDPAITAYRRNGFSESSIRPVTLSMHGAVIMDRAVSQAS
jgi:GNAT superfamily N-acetyltransferase